MTLDGSDVTTCPREGEGEMTLSDLMLEAGSVQVGGHYHCRVCRDVPCSSSWEGVPDVRRGPWALATRAGRNRRASFLAVHGACMGHQGAADQVVDGLSLVGYPDARM